jgi:hypothetical protein
METVDIIKHFDRMSAIADMIIAEAHRIEQLERLREQKNWLFYTVQEKKDELQKFAHKITIHQMALDRLKTYYKNNSKLN